MKLKLRKDKNDVFGFVENFKDYRYVDNGSISMMVLALTGSSVLPEPFVYRADQFVPISNIHREMGISKYIKAKKPFYSVLGSGNIIIDMRVAFDISTGQYSKERSRFKLYIPDINSLTYSEKEGYSVTLKRLTSSSSQLEEFLDSLGSKIAETAYDREKFLINRMGVEE